MPVITTGIASGCCLLRLVGRPSWRLLMGIVVVHAVVFVVAAALLLLLVRPDAQVEHRIAVHVSTTGNGARPGNDRQRWEGGKATSFAAPHESPEPLHSGLVPAVDRPATPPGGSRLVELQPRTRQPLSPPDDLSSFAPRIRNLLAQPSAGLQSTRAEIAFLAGGARNASTGCRGGCSERGRCDELLGQCACRHGYSGAQCEVQQPRASPQPLPAAAACRSHLPHPPPRYGRCSLRRSATTRAPDAPTITIATSGHGWSPAVPAVATSHRTGASAARALGTRSGRCSCANGEASTE